MSLDIPCAKEFLVLLVWHLWQKNLAFNNNNNNSDQVYNDGRITFLKKCYFIDQKLALHMPSTDIDFHTGLTHVLLLLWMREGLVLGVVWTRGVRGCSLRHWVVRLLDIVSGI